MSEKPEVKQEGNVAALARVMHGLGAAQSIAALGPSGEAAAQLLVVPRDKTVVALEPFLAQVRKRPLRREVTVKLRSTASLIELTNRHRHERNTVVFAMPDRQRPSLAAVFDYHPPTANVDEAEWGKHRAFYAPELSEEWKAWTGAHGKTLDQRAFAEFVEDHVADVIVPPADDEKLAALAELVGGRYATPADLVTLSRGLQVSSEVKVRDAVTLSTGEIAVTYEESHRDGKGAPLQVPNLFVLAIPVFYAGPLYRIPVRLRYTLREGGVKWSVHLVRHDRVFDHAFDEICVTVQQHTGVPLFIGAPE